MKKKIKEMVKARITKPASSLWGFPVVIVEKSNARPRFFVDYRVQNNRMKAEKSPTTKIEKMIDSTASASVFSKLDNFSS